MAGRRDTRVRCARGVGRKIFQLRRTAPDGEMWRKMFRFLYPGRVFAILLLPDEWCSWLILVATKHWKRTSEDENWYFTNLPLSLPPPSLPPFPPPLKYCALPVCYHPSLLCGITMEQLYIFLSRSFFLFLYTDISLSLSLSVAAHALTRSSRNIYIKPWKKS